MGSRTDREQPSDAAPAPRADQAALRYTATTRDRRSVSIEVRRRSDGFWAATSNDLVSDGHLPHEAVRRDLDDAVADCLDSVKRHRGFYFVEVLAEGEEPRAALLAQVAGLRAALERMLAAVAHTTDMDGRRECVGCAATWDDRRDGEEWHEGELCHVVVARALLADPPSACQIPPTASVQTNMSTTLSDSPDASTLAVRAALDRSAARMPEYFARMLAQRAGADPQACGSIYPGRSADELGRVLRARAWRPFAHPAIDAQSVRAFIADLPGELGIVALDTIPGDAYVSLEDPKATGCVEAVLVNAASSGWVVGYTVIILGMDEGEEVVFTFHPGDPIVPSRVPSEGNAGRVIAVRDAIGLGLRSAKVRGAARG